MITSVRICDCVFLLLLWHEKQDLTLFYTIFFLLFYTFFKEIFRIPKLKRYCIKHNTIIKPI